MSAHGLIERKGKDQIASRTSIKSVGRHKMKVAGEREILPTLLSSSRASCSRLPKLKEQLGWGCRT